MNLFKDTFLGQRVLVTGHTGFKGSWLALWLTRLGARVSGYALDPETELNHWRLLNLEIDDRRGDIRDYAQLQDAVTKAEPAIVFHLAAQPLVRRSYADPLSTWSTNVMGTANVLEACRNCESVRAILVATTDKVYENREWPWGYREEDRLGGHDPYSASKACTELLATSYRSAFFEGKTLLATARAGNVIGGGDWSEDRLIPDLVKATYAGNRLELRSPKSTRPWQHVLECLSGYLSVGQRLLEGHAWAASSWNFGPGPQDNRQVIEILERLQPYWPDLAWSAAGGAQPHETNLLYLDNSKAQRALHWRPVLKLEKCLEYTASWYDKFYREQEVASEAQLEDYVQIARECGLEWCEA